VLAGPIRQERRGSSPAVLAIIVLAAPATAAPKPAITYTDTVTTGNGTRVIAGNLADPKPALEMCAKTPEAAALAMAGIRLEWQQTGPAEWTAGTNGSRSRSPRDRPAVRPSSTVAGNGLFSATRALWLLGKHPRRPGAKPAYFLRQTRRG
jgi:hypothetical protein